MSDEFFRMTDIVKTYHMGDEEQTVLKHVNLTIDEGEFLSVLGPSGSGKSTLMNIIGCLDTPTSGEYVLRGRTIRDLDESQLAAIRSREIGFIFQSFQLLPRLDALRNVELPLIYAGVPQRERTRRAEEMLERVGLKNRMHHYAKQLSGGQQQRVAIARSLVNEPEVLLLDEPLGALDLKLRKEMQLELKSMQQRLGITFIFVTHDQEEALTMSDTIVVMKDGTIQQIGDPKTIYDEPANAFVADFIGESNLLRGTMIHDELVEFAGTEFPCVDFGFGENTPVDVVVRPEDIMLVGEDVGQMVGTIKSVLFKGVHYEMMIDTGAYTFKVHSTTMQPQGSRVGLNIVPFNIHIMKRLEDTTPAAEVDAEC